MARKSSFTIRAQKHVQYTDAKEEGSGNSGEGEGVERVCVWWDGVYAKFKRDGGYKLPNCGSGRTNISQVDRNKIIRPEAYYRYFL